MALYNYTGTVTYGDLAKKSYTLDDLEKNDEFQKTSERFLESVGEKSDDVFEYLRDSDFNLFSGMNRAIQSGKFNEQQKQDYAYLRSSSCASYRLTLLAHFFDPSSKYGVGGLLRLIRNR